MFRATLISAALALGLAGCATPTPYQPLVQQGAVRGGFSEQMIEPDRVRVTFTGNSLTSREAVEIAMLYRAAELTLARDYDWFELADRQTDRKSVTSGLSPWGISGGGWGRFGHGPMVWGHHGGGAGWIGPGHGGGWLGWGGGDMVRTEDRFTAFGEVLLRRGPKPADNAAAFDARAVIYNLGPRIRRPVDARPAHNAGA